MRRDKRGSDAALGAVRGNRRGHREDSEMSCLLLLLADPCRIAVFRLRNYRGGIAFNRHGLSVKLFQHRAGAGAKDI